jgi:hypothetical protein
VAGMVMLIAFQPPLMATVTVPVRGEDQVVVAEAGVDLLERAELAGAVVVGQLQRTACVDRGQIGERVTVEVTLADPAVAAPAGASPISAASMTAPAILAGNDLDFARDFLAFYPS